MERESAYQEAEIELNGTMRRLQALGLTTSELNEIIEKGEPRHQLTVTAPVSGQIVEQGATLGATVEPKDTLFQILDTTTVLVEGDV
ncbi:efflux RND transporter periplasmic adaptor subunit, partial [Candidatus Poribacteria bacterium]|nr:efflux RND transporter periplasmic adaptor subunit [Candidatus Poribacteria bacterium]